jgi:hypothetical protein
MASEEESPSQHPGEVLVPSPTMEYNIRSNGQSISNSCIRLPVGVAPWSTGVAITDFTVYLGGLGPCIQGGDRLLNIAPQGTNFSQDLLAGLCPNPIPCQLRGGPPPPPSREPEEPTARSDGSARTVRFFRFRGEGFTGETKFFFRILKFKKMDDMQMG